MTHSVYQAVITLYYSIDGYIIIDFRNWPAESEKTALLAALRSPKNNGQAHIIWRALIECAKSDIWNHVAYDVIDTILQADLRSVVKEAISLARFSCWFSAHEEQRLLAFAKRMIDLGLINRTIYLNSRATYRIYELISTPTSHSSLQPIDKWIMDGVAPTTVPSATETFHGEWLTWKKALHVLEFLLVNNVFPGSTTNVWHIVKWKPARDMLYKFMPTASKQIARNWCYLFDLDLLIKHEASEVEVKCVIAAATNAALDRQSNLPWLWQGALRIAKHYNLVSHVASIMSMIDRAESNTGPFPRSAVWAIFLLLAHGSIGIVQCNTAAARMFRITMQLPLELQMAISALLYPRPSTEHHLGQYVWHPDSLPDQAATIATIRELAHVMQN